MIGQIQESHSVLTTRYNKDVDVDGCIIIILLASSPLPPSFPGTGTLWVEDKVIWNSQESLYGGDPPRGANFPHVGITRNVDI